MVSPGAGLVDVERLGGNAEIGVAAARFQAPVKLGDAAGENDVRNQLALEIGIAGHHLVVDEHRAVGDVNHVAADGVERALGHLGDVARNLAVAVLGEPR